MNASKENCRKAQQIIAQVADDYTQQAWVASTEDIKFLEQFLARVEAKLPCESSFSKPRKKKIQPVIKDGIVDYYPDEKGDK